jgi:geranylgeranyl pyrophosphate synthase
MVNDFLDALPSEILEKARNLDLNIRSSMAHEAIDEILSRSVLRGGKRLRPLLTYLMGNLFNLALDKMSPYARASELVHAASLTHDDVIDNATLRRGLPSINIVSSNKKAVLAGDYLLSKVIVDLCAAGNLELVREMSLVIKDLSEGEWLQLDLQHDRNYTRETIKEVALKKTSSVMSYCTLAPALLFCGENKNELIISNAKDFGIHLGLAFQLIDDTLDFSGDSLKDQLLDIQNGVVNSVIFEYLETHPDKFKKFKERTLLSDLVVLEDMEESVSKIEKLAHDYLEKAANNLNNLEIELKKMKISNEHHQIDMASDYLKLILSYLALRKN